MVGVIKHLIINSAKSLISRAKMRLIGRMRHRKIKKSLAKGQYAEAGNAEYGKSIASDKNQ